MARVTNPFRPTAGATPPLLVGRDAQLDEFAESIENGPGAPGMLTLVTGARGVGKTVMLTELGEIARRDGWVVIDETATTGVLARIADAADQHRTELGRPDRPRVSGFGLAKAANISLDLPARPNHSWRQRLQGLLDVVEARETGVLITIDEVHAMDRDDLRQLAADMQHLVREDRWIAVAMAGLPSAITDLLNDDVATFLRRAERVQLDDVAVADVRDSLATTFHNTGRTLDDASLDRAAEATGGYPFMIQLVGYHLWRRADPDGVITPAAVTTGIDAARVRLGSLVHETSLADLSSVDRTILAAMATDDGPTRVGDIATRIGRDASYVSVYRERLLKAGVIKAPRYGYVDFALPHLRDYLREHAVSLGHGALNDDPTQRPLESDPR